MDSPIFAFVHIRRCKSAFNLKLNNRMAYSVDSDVATRYNPSHLDLQSLHMYLILSAGLKGIKSDDKIPWLQRSIFLYTKEINSRPF